jgi:hypothetical protein
VRAVVQTHAAGALGLSPDACWSGLALVKEHLRSYLSDEAARAQRQGESAAAGAQAALDWLRASLCVPCSAPLPCAVTPAYPALTLRAPLLHHGVRVTEGECEWHEWPERWPSGAHDGRAAHTVRRLSLAQRTVGCEHPSRRTRARCWACNARRAAMSRRAVHGHAPTCRRGCCPHTHRREGGALYDVLSPSADGRRAAWCARRRPRYTRYPHRGRML